MRGSERAAIIIAIVTSLSGIVVALVQSGRTAEAHLQTVQDLKDSYALTAAKVNDLSEKVGMLEGYVVATKARAAKLDKSVKSVLKLDEITVAGHVGSGFDEAKAAGAKLELSSTLPPALPETLDEALKAKRAK